MTITIGILIMMTTMIKHTILTITATTTTITATIMTVITTIHTIILLTIIGTIILDPEYAYLGSS